MHVFHVTYLRKIDLYLLGGSLLLVDLGLFTLAIGTQPMHRDKLKNLVIEGVVLPEVCFSIPVEIPSGPLALVTSMQEGQ